MAGYPSLPNPSYYGTGSAIPGTSTFKAPNKDMMRAISAFLNGNGTYNSKPVSIFTRRSKG